MNQKNTFSRILSLLARIIGSIALIIALTVAGIWLLWDSHGQNRLKDEIERIVSQKIAGQFSIEKLSLPARWPVRLDLNEVYIVSNELGIEGPVKLISLQLDLKAKSLLKKKLFPLLTLNLKGADLRLQPSIANVPTTVPSTASSESQIPQDLGVLKQMIPQLEDLTAFFNISDSQISLRLQDEKTIRVTRLQTQINLKNLQTPIQFSTQFSVLAPLGLLNFPIPVTTSGQINIKKGQLDLSGVSAQILNIQSQFSAQADLTNKSFQAQLYTRVDDLSKVPIGSVDSPISDWKGSLFLSTIVKKQSDKYPIQASGQFQLNNFSSMLRYKVSDEFKEILRIEGPISLGTRGQFQFLESGVPQFRFPSLVWNADLSALSIKYIDIFEKDSTTKLMTSGEINWNEKIEIKSSNFEFFTLRADAAGFLDYKRDSDLQVNLGAPSLAGFQKFVPILASAPLDGRVQGSVRVTGPLSDYKLLKIDIKNLELSQGRGSIALKRDGFEANGPFAIDLRLSSLIKEMKVVTAKASVRGDLTQVKVGFKNYFSKPSQELFKLDLSVQKEAHDFKITNGQINFAAGNLVLSGTPPLLPDAPFDLSVGLNRINLSKLRQTVPLLQPYIEGGQYSGQFKLNGSLNSKDVLQSPLSISGNQEVTLPSYTYHSPPPKRQSSNGTQAPPTVPKALLPESPLISRLNVKTQISLNQFQFDDLTIKGVRISSLVANSKASASGSLDDIFGGKIRIQSAEIPLTSENPTVSFNVGIVDISGETSLDWLSPKTRGLADGLISIEAKGTTLLPSSPNFLDELKTSGKCTGKNIVLNTLQFEEMIKDKLSKVPGIGGKKSSAGPLEMNLLCEFDLNKKQIKLKQFRAITARNEQLKLEGSLGFDLNANLKGSMALVDAPVSGSFFQANKDKDGRLVIPVLINGNLMSPSLSFLEEPLKAMLEKTVLFEKKKAETVAKNQVAVVKKDVEDKVKVEAEKKAKQLEKDIKKNFENLFK